MLRANSGFDSRRQNRSEYRTRYALKWVELLCARGFDPAAVERQFRPQCWELQF